MTFISLSKSIEFDGPIHSISALHYKYSRRHDGGELRDSPLVYVVSEGLVKPLYFAILFIFSDEF